MKRWPEMFRDQSNSKKYISDKLENSRYFNLSLRSLFVPVCELKSHESLHEAQVIWYLSYMAIFVLFYFTIRHKKWPQRQIEMSGVLQVVRNVFLGVWLIPKHLMSSFHFISLSSNSLQGDEKCIFSHKTPWELKIHDFEPFLSLKSFESFSFKCPYKIF